LLWPAEEEEEEEGAAALTEAAVLTEAVAFTEATASTEAAFREAAALRTTVLYRTDHSILDIGFAMIMEASSVLILYSVVSGPRITTPITSIPLRTTMT
jgi:hypothetical protein